MTAIVQKMYESYWEGKRGLEDFEVYERNAAIGSLIEKGEKVLDLACGEGVVSEYIQNLGAEVIGLDISKEALKKAQERGIKVVLGDAEEKLPFKHGFFDVVFWGDNAEHLFLPGKTLEEVNRVLKKGGRLIISCPNMGYWRYRIYYLVRGMLPQTEWYGKNPWEWEHIRFFNKEIMSEFLKNGGFRMERFLGISKRRLDQPLKNFLPDIFGMIMVVEAKKQ